VSARSCYRSRPAGRGDRRQDGDFSKRKFGGVFRRSSARDSEATCNATRPVISRRPVKALQGHVDDITYEPLPRRGVELIHFLDEQGQSVHNVRKWKKPCTASDGAESRQR
jgi:hypothetical protein